MQKKTKIKFGTDGWRGIIGKDFIPQNIEAVAQAISDYLRQYALGNKHYAKVVVGYDNRRFSPEAARLVSQVLAANRIKVVLSHRPLPTPAISYTVRAQKCIAGIMVTASHNPSYFNGIKLKGCFGGSVENKVTNRIEKLIFRHIPVKISFHQAQQKNLLKIVDIVSDYLKFVKSYLDMPLLKKAGLKILVDSMYGTADAYIARILNSTSCKVRTIHGSRNLSFGGITPEPIAAQLKEATILMQRKHFDLGLACDGDADRIAAFDEQGKFINPQQIISILLLYLIKYRKLKGAVVKTISGTSLLEKIAKRYKLKIYETPVGFKHISYLMQKKDILIGGEEGGGIGFKNYFPERDGILAGLLLLESLIAENKSAAEVLQDIENEFGRYVYLREDIKCPNDRKDMVKKRLAIMHKQKTFFNTKIIHIQDYDGLKYYLADDSWILFRLSGTEPLLRIYAESESVAKTKKLIVEGMKVIKL
jgi:alpha-D-glucose phosphate-specific phosphoglucomutase